MSTKQRKANEARQNHFTHFLDENYLISLILAAKKDGRELDFHILVTHSTSLTCVDLLLCTQCPLIKIRKSILKLRVEQQ